MLMQGVLTPILIDKFRLRELQAVREHLSNRHPRTYLLWNRVADVYAGHSFVYGRQQEHLLIQTHLPVTPNLYHFFLYEVETFPVAVHGQKDHITEIRDLPKYFVATDSSRFYIIPRHVDNSDGSNILNLARGRDPFRSFGGNPICVSALFKDNRQLIHDLCNFRLFKSSLLPSIIDTQVLLLYVSNATLFCGEHLPIQIPKCLMCTHQIRCDCVLRTWSKDGEVEMAYLPKTASCDTHDPVTITRNIVNLAVLQHFFND